MTSALNLSLLARGVGEVKRNGHEKIDVILEPGDYHNFTESQQSRLFLPPVPPTISETPRHNYVKGLSLPKTFITRKGALLLFSEDFAHKTKDPEPGEYQGKDVTASLSDLDLHTVDDLAKSILSYGGTHHKGEINLHFVKEGRVPKRVRPGFSARRYLSKLTRSFDEAFLDNLLSKGYVSEKSIFQTNSLLPNLRKRINDDLSHMPAPYRIMRQMLLAPGMLSGFSFYRQPTDATQSDLSTVLEEEEDIHKGHSRQGQADEPAELKIVEIKDGVARSVVYGNLDQEDKQNVLADLLVKSAISHALERQKQILEERSSTQRTQSENEDHSLMVSGHGSVKPSQTGEDLADFDMGDAVKSYIDSQLSGQVHDDVTSTSRSLGARVAAVRALEDSVVLPPISTGNEDALRRQLRDSPGQPLLTTHSPGGSTSHRSSHHQQKAGQDEGFPTKVPVLPPIQPGMREVEIHLSDGSVQRAVVDADGVPQFSVEPPTPQNSTLVDRRSKVSRSPGGGELLESDEEGAAWPGKESSVKEHGKRRDRLQTGKDVPSGSQQSLVSASSSARSGPVLGAGSIFDSGSESTRSEYSHPSGPQMPKFRGKALRAGGKGDVKKDRKVKDPSRTKGSVIMMPGGDVMNVGGSMTAPSSDIAQNAPAQSYIHRSYGDARQGHDVASAATSQEISEQELVQQLSDQAHRIAAAILSRPATGMDLVEDAQAAARLWVDSTPRHTSARSKAGQLLQKPGASVVDEYKTLLKETINTALTQAQGVDADLVPTEADIDEEVVMAIAHQDDLDADDLEIIETEPGKQVVRIKSSRKEAIKAAREKKRHDSTGKRSSIHVPSQKSVGSVHSDSPSRGHHSGPEDEGGSERGRHSQRSKGLFVPATTPGASSSTPGASSSHSGADSQSSKSKVGLLSGVQRSESKSGVSLSGASDTSDPRPNVSRSKSKTGTKKEDTKEEFVVGTVHDSSQLQRLYGPVDEPEAKPKEAKKPKASPTKSGKKTKKLKSKSKDRSQSPNRSRASGSDKEGSPTRDKKKKKLQKKKSKTESESQASKAPSEDGTDSRKEEEEEEMEFIIIRDEFSDSDTEAQADTKSTKSKKSTKSVATHSTDAYSDAESDASLYTVSSKEARAAERAARANKRREEVEQKRREREDLQRRDKFEMDERERMQRELEEERRRKEEERRMAREQDEADRKRKEQEEVDRERRMRLEAEREKKIKEEYARKLELMKKQKEEEERKRKELEEERLREEEERRREEEAMMAAMEEEERLEYMRRKAEEEERMKIELEERKRREAEEILRLEAEARFMAEEMARRQAEMERRLQFNRGLHLEADGMDHSHNITEAFTWSYFELLQWLGLDLPDFERMRFEPH